MKKGILIGVGITLIVVVLILGTYVLITSQNEGANTQTDAELSNQAMDIKTDVQHSSIGKAEVKTLTGKEYITEDGKKALISTEQLVLFNVRGDYARLLNKKFEDQAKAEIKRTEGLIVTEANVADMYGERYIGQLAGESKTKIVSNHTYKKVTSVYMEHSGYLIMGSGYISPEVVNINLETGAPITNIELLDIYKLDSDKVKENIAWKYIENYVSEETDEETKRIISENLSLDYMDQYRLYIDKNNDLNVVLHFGILAPKSYKLN